MFSRGCTCNVGWNWENGPCDYCTSEYCHDCEHIPEECPEDCYCECNDNEEEVEE